jgi:hypothetical protein
VRARYTDLLAYAADANRTYAESLGLEYVETMQLVNQLTTDEIRDTDRPPNLLPIDDPAMLFTQSQTAEEIAARRVRDIAAAGLDPSFVQWNSRWGADLAYGRLPTLSRLDDSA